jgi:hypothetical protein
MAKEQNSQLTIPKGKKGHYEIKIWKEFKKAGKVYKIEESERTVDVSEFDYDAFYTTPKKGGKEEKTVMEKLGFKFEIVNKPL